MKALHNGPQVHVPWTATPNIPTSQLHAHNRGMDISFGSAHFCHVQLPIVLGERDIHTVLQMRPCGKRVSHFSKSICLGTEKFEL